MYKIYFSVGDFSSNPISIGDDKMYEWSNLSVQLDSAKHGVDISFYIDGAQWHVHHFTTEELNASPKSLWRKLTNGDGRLYMHWEERKQGFTLLRLILTIYDFKESINSVQHKITCLVAEEKFNFYLGRPQNIITNYDTMSRVYIWTSKTGAAFGEVKLHIFHDNLDEHLSEIKEIMLECQDLNAILSARSTDVNFESEIDNDHFHNDYRVLPITIHDNEFVVVRFYNFKTPKLNHIDVTMSQADLLKSKTRLTRVIREIDGVLTVYHEDGITIKSIILVVQNFRQNLRFKLGMVPLPK